MTRYLRDRWKASPLVQDVDDAIQDVFMECFRERGVLQRADPERGSGFRAFLLGATRNVARRFERQAHGKSAHRQPETDVLNAIESEEDRLIRNFERDWAQAIMKEAAAHHERLAMETGGNLALRWQALRCQFERGLDVQAIASELGGNPATVHKWIQRGRQDFAGCLHDVVAGQCGPDVTPEEIERECRRLAEFLS